jgi:hypothetical protein
MSKERARRRAEQRARKHAPKSPAGASNGSAGEAPAGRSTQRRSQSKAKSRKARQRTAREQRQRNRMIVIAAVWLLANALIFAFTDTWNAKWLGLTVTTILVPVVVWLVWDPEGRVDL